MYVPSFKHIPSLDSLSHYQVNQYRDESQSPIPSFNFEEKISPTSRPSQQQPPKSTDKTKKLLPADFKPTEFSVICGSNKRKSFNSPGNSHFRSVCELFVGEFKQATTKQDKSAVVSKVMTRLREACPVGTFCAFEKGCWRQVSERTAREKVGTFFRDCLGDAYKSSSKNKIASRRSAKKRVVRAVSSNSRSCESSVSSNDDSQASFSFLGNNQTKPLPSRPALSALLFKEHVARSTTPMQAGFEAFQQTQRCSASSAATGTYCLMSPQEQQLPVAFSSATDMSMNLCFMNNKPPSPFPEIPTGVVTPSYERQQILIETPEILENLFELEDMMKKGQVEEDEESWDSMQVATFFDVDDLTPVTF
jgi:hypothetical protein